MSDVINKLLESIESKMYKLFNDISSPDFAGRKYIFIESAQTTACGKIIKNYPLVSLDPFVLDFGKKEYTVKLSLTHNSHDVVELLFIKINSPKAAWFELNDFSKICSGFMDFDFPVRVEFTSGKLTSEPNDYDEIDYIYLGHINDVYKLMRSSGDTRFDINVLD